MRRQKPYGAMDPTIFAVGSFFRFLGDFQPRTLLCAYSGTFGHRIRKVVDTGSEKSKGRCRETGGRWKLASLFCVLLPDYSLILDDTLLDQDKNLQYSACSKLGLMFNSESLFMIVLRRF